jgi:hypothetical protein
MFLNHLFDDRHIALKKINHNLNPFTSSTATMRFTLPIAALILSAAAMPTGSIASTSATKAAAALEPPKADFSPEDAQLSSEHIYVKLWKDINHQGDCVSQSATGPSPFVLVSLVLIS